MYAQIRVAIEVQRRRYLLLIYIGLFLILVGILISFISYRSFYYSFLPVFIISGLTAIVIGMRRRRYMKIVLDQPELQVPSDDDSVPTNDMQYMYATTASNDLGQFKEWIHHIDKNNLPPLPEYSESAIPSYPPPSFVSSYSLNRTDDEPPTDNPPSYEVATSSHENTVSQYDIQYNAIRSDFVSERSSCSPSLSQEGASSSRQSEPE